MSKAFSLLELIIVMAIVAVLMAMGAFFLVRYQSSVQLQSAYTYTVSSIRTIQNKANNSASVTVGSNRVSPDIFAVRFNNNQMNPFYCLYSSGGALTNCNVYPTSGIEQFENTYNVNATSDCTGIGFTRLGLDTLTFTNSAFTGNGTTTTTGTCTITLTHKTTGDSRTLRVNLDQNKIDL